MSENGTLEMADTEIAEAATKIVTSMSDLELDQKHAICRMVIDLIIKDAKQRQEEMEKETREHELYLRNMEKLINGSNQNGTKNLLD